MTTQGEGPSEESQVEIHAHQIFALPIWTMQADVLAPHRQAIFDDVRSYGTSSSAGWGESEGLHWDRYRALVIKLADLLAKRAQLGWRDRTINESPLWFAQADDVAAERNGIEVHPTATFSMVLWLSTPEVSPGEDPPALVLRNPLNHLTQSYKVPTYANHPAQPLGLVAFPGFVERFVTAGSLRTWSAPLSAIRSDVHFY